MTKTEQGSNLQNWFTRPILQLACQAKGYYDVKITEDTDQSTSKVIAVRWVTEVRYSIIGWQCCSSDGIYNLQVAARLRYTIKLFIVSLYWSNSLSWLQWIAFFKKLIVGFVNNAYVVSCQLGQYWSEDISTGSGSLDAACLLPSS